MRTVRMPTQGRIIRLFTFRLVPDFLVNTEHTSFDYGKAGARTSEDGLLFRVQLNVWPSRITEMG